MDGEGKGMILFKKVVFLCTYQLLRDRSLSKTFSERVMTLGFEKTFMPIIIINPTAISSCFICRSSTTYTLPADLQCEIGPTWQ